MPSRRAETLAAPLGEERLEPAPPAQLDDAPARGAEPLGDLAPAAIGRDAIEALAIHVHDPEKAAQTRHVLFEERLPYVALVELGVAHHGNEALALTRLPVIGDVAPGHRGERRRHRS